MASGAKNFLVTGAGRGIGRGLSRLLLQRGHRVFLLDSDEEELNCTVALLSESHKHGVDFGASLCNLRELPQIKLATEQAYKLFSGHLDCLINNAAYTGGVGGTPLANMTLKQWNTSIETNLTAPMLMSQACLPMLRTSLSRLSGGCILHISSTRAFMSEPNNEAYSATKAGLLGLSQSMAVSLAPVGIRVNAIVLGWIHADNECKGADKMEELWSDGLRVEDQESHLTSRVGNVEDVFRAVNYLVDAEFVSGTETVVDGGVTRKMVYPDED